jgi:hypothetical protein
MAVIDQSPLSQPGVIRNKPIGDALRRVLERAADSTQIEIVRIVSGSQPGTHGRSTGSTRHNNGRAADLQLIKNGATLTFTDQSGRPAVEAFVTAAAANGATGIGAGVEYMGNRTIHVGFGLTPQDRSKLVWGAGGRSANAPAWLRAAARKGWDNPAPEGSLLAAAPGRFVVIARGGLNLRKGPGLEFGVTRTLETGAEVTVVALDGPAGEWARVDLENDGLVDGHLLTAFLRPLTSIEHSEEVDEPGAGEA